MSSNQQALLMAGGSSGVPPVATCIADPYYDTPSGDPYWSNVVLLLHGDGTNGATTFTDSSSYAQTMAISAGSPALSTAQKQFGTAAIYGGSGSPQITTSQNTAEWASDSWTWECWYRRAADGDHHGFLYTADGGAIVLLKTPINSGTYQLFITLDSFSFLTSTSSTVLNQWTHLAFSVAKSGGTYTARLFFNGVLEASTTTTSASLSLKNFAGSLSIGRTDLAGFAGLDGYVDEYRITTVCRYVADFDVQTEAFPNAGRTDPHTVFSLHGEAIVDSSSEPKTLTNSGTTVSTVEHKFGDSSILFPASPQASIYTTQIQDFIFQPATAFTVEFWINLVASPAGGAADVVCFGAPGAGSGNAPVRSGWAIGVTSSRQLIVRIGDLSASTYNAATTTGILATSTWTHIAVSVYGTTTVPSIFFDGIPQATTEYGAVSWALVDPREPDTSRLYLGIYDKQAGGSAIITLNAYVDDLRITKSIARYSGAFTPPALTFCDSETPSYTGQVNGTEQLEGQQLATSLGTLSVANPWVKLSGQVVTMNAGSVAATFPNKTAALTGIAIASSQGSTVTPNRTAALAGTSISTATGVFSAAPYPTLLNSTVSTRQNVSSVAGSVCTVNIFPDGTYTVIGLLGGTLGSGTWIDTTNSSFDIPTIAIDYDLQRVILLSAFDLSFPTLPQNLAAQVVVQVPADATRPESCTFVIVIAPASTNPRYGEAGYVSQINIRIQNRFV